jgi:hypothetical protein
VKESNRLSDSFTVTPHIRLALRPTDRHAFNADAFCARSSAKYQTQLRTIPRGQSHMVGSWEVVIATLHTDLVHNLVHNYVSIKPSSCSGPATTTTTTFLASHTARTANFLPPQRVSTVDDVQPLASVAIPPTRTLSV